MNSLEIFDNNQQYASASKVKIGGNTYIREDLVDQQIAELKEQLKEKSNKIKELEKELSDVSSYVFNIRKWLDGEMDKLEDKNE